MISFIVPAHNEEELISRTLSAIRQSMAVVGAEYEMIVVNDDSTDRTAELARAQGAQVIDVRHRQIAATRNAGGRAAAGETLVFVDADTSVTPAAIQAAARSVWRGAIGGGSLVRFDGRIPFYATVIERVALPVILPLFGIAAGCFLFCTRQAFQAAGGFDESLYCTEEVDFARRLKAQGRFVILRKYVVTSGRKVRTHSLLALLWIGIRLLIGGRRAIQRREGLDYWYGKRQSQR